MIYPHFLLWLSPEVGSQDLTGTVNLTFAEQWPVSPMIVLQLKGKMWVRAVVPKPLMPFLLLNVGNHQCWRLSLQNSKL